MTDKIECAECRGTGDVMIRDCGVAGCEEYGTCRKCRGTGKVAPDPRDLRIAELEARVRRLEGSP